uniref:L-selectin n=1 Tax=Lepeophtheirus salmonis TaxID=72036 RepID=D3PG02_LEPSM|nr:L-selectin [Lepeophtheirus salmonis]
MILKLVISFSTLFIILFIQPVHSQKGSGNGDLQLPNKSDCRNRIIHASFGGKQYFFSWEYSLTQNLPVNWITARNICRRHCMDTVSIETLEENQFIENRMLLTGTRFTWTSGRKCNFEGCDRPDLQPTHINGWFWSGSGVRLGSRNGRVEGDWSNTGGDGEAQPDNREFRVKGEHEESCIAVMNNFYNDGIVWHDIACYHKKPFVCESSDQLMDYINQRSNNLI